MRKRRATGIIGAILVMAMALTPAQADYQYFRMYGSGSFLGPETPPPAGTLTYFVIGATSATVGKNYAATSQVIGAVGQPSFSLQSGQLPPGVSLNPASGELYGAPATAGTFDGVIRVTDAASAVGLASFHIAVSNPLVVDWIPATGKVGQAYNPTPPIVAGGRAPFSYALTGTAPAGLSFTPSTGLLVGTPIEAGDYALATSVTDADGRQAATGLKTLTVAPADVDPQPDQLAIQGTPGVETEIGVAYLAHFSATGGEAPYTFDLAAGALPHGISISSDGTISGTPDTAGISSGLQVRVTDGLGATALSGIFSITVKPQADLQIAGTPSETARVGEAYTAIFTAFDGSGTGYSFESVGAALPGGLSLSIADGTTAILSGAPLTAGTYAGLQIRVSDSEGHTAVSDLFTIVVSPPAGPPPVLAGAPSVVVQGSAYSFDLTSLTNSGTAPYTYSLQSGQLPTGMSMNPGGNVTATMVTGHTAAVDIHVADAIGRASDATLTFEVTEATSSFVATSSNQLRAGKSYTGVVASNMPGATFSIISTISPTGPSLDWTVDASGLASAVVPNVSQITTYNTASVATAPTGFEAVSTPSVLLTAYPSPAIAGGPSGEVKINTGSAFPPQPALVLSNVYSTATYSLLRDGAPISSFDTLCPGISFSETTGTFSGTPTTACSVTGLAIKVVDAFDNTDAVTASTFSIAAIAPLTLSGTPPAADPGAAYNFDLRTLTSGASGTLSFVVQSGGLPGGMSFGSSGGDSNNLVTASAVTGSTQSVTLMVTDGDARQVTSTLQFKVNPLPAPTGLLAASAFAGEPYSSGPLTTHGGTAPFTWQVASGSLPPGLALEEETGVVAGTPSGPSGSFSLNATDANGIVSQPSATMTISINPGLAISGTAPDGMSGNAYSFKPTTSGGSGGNTFSIINTTGTLSALGLTLNTATGEISGADPIAGAWSGKVMVTNAAGASAQLTSSITVISAISNAVGWGFNPFGAVGDGSTVNRSSPRTVLGGLTFAKFGSGYFNSCGIVADGSAYCWGENTSGQLGDGTTTNRSTPVRVFNLTGVSDISLSRGHGCAVVNGGAVCWGNNGSGELGDGTTTNRSSPVQVSGLTSGVTNIRTSGVAGFTCAVVNGAAKCWGNAGSAGQLGDGTTVAKSVPTQVTGLTSGVTQVAVGTTSACALVGGAVKCWGNNGSGQLGNGTKTQSLVPVAVMGLESGVTQISMIATTACAIQNGAAKCWGLNQNGAIGDGSATDRTIPVQVFGLTSGVTSISGGDSFACAVVNGAAKCWGSNAQAQLGDGTLTPKSTPTQVLGLTSGITEIVAAIASVAR